MPSTSPNYACHMMLVDDTDTTNLLLKILSILNFWAKFPGKWNFDKSDQRKGRKNLDILDRYSTSWNRNLYCFKADEQLFNQFDCWQGWRLQIFPQNCLPFTAKWVAPILFLVAPSGASVGTATSDACLPRTRGCLKSTHTFLQRNAPT